MFVNPAALMAAANLSASLLSPVGAFVVAVDKVIVFAVSSAN